MSNNPEEIRTDIEYTQAELGRDVDALAEKVHPAKAAERQKERLRDKFRNVRETVMGTPEAGPQGDSSGKLHQAGERAQDLAHQASDQISELGDQAGEAVQNIPDKVTSGTRGNPLAAGLIAFGAGWLAASLIPSSRMEQDADRRLQPTPTALSEITRPRERTEQPLRLGKKSIMIAPSMRRTITQPATLL